MPRLPAALTSLLSSPATNSSAPSYLGGARVVVTISDGASAASPKPRYYRRWRGSKPQSGSLAPPSVQSSHNKTMKAALLGELCPTDGGGPFYTPPRMNVYVECTSNVGSQ